MRHGVKGLLFGGLTCCAALATAGAPLLDDTCGARLHRPVVVRYESAAPAFAEARQVRGDFIIFINPEIYFVGRQTQQWLYERQCVHIQLNHAVVRVGEKGLRPADEESADCLALAAFGPLAKSRSLRASIESDIERATRAEKWRQVLPGPQRRISFDRCLG